MIPTRAPLATILLAVLVASCGGRPGVTVSVSGETVRTRLMSTTDGTPCSATHGDYLWPTPTPTTVRGPAPVAIRVDTDQGFVIRGWIYDVDAPQPSGGPLEEFTLTSGGTYQSRAIVAARTYDITVNAARTVLGLRTEVTHAVRICVAP